MLINKKSAGLLLASLGLAVTGVALAQVSGSGAPVDMERLFANPTSQLSQQAPAARPVLVLKKIYGHKVHNNGVSLVVEETHSDYLISVSPHVPTGAWAGHLVDPKVIGHVAVSHSVLGIEVSHPVTQVGETYVTSIPKNSLSPGNAYEFKASVWEPGTNWSSESDAFYLRSMTLIF